MMTKLIAIEAETHATAERTEKVAMETRRVAANNRLLSGLLLAMVALGAVGAFFIGGQLSDIQSRMHPVPAEEQRRLRERLDADEKVEGLLERLADDFDADRTLVFLAHNGQTDLTGLVPFVWISNTHVHLRPGLAWEERWSRPSSLSSFAPLMRRLFRDGYDKPACVKRDRGDAEVSETARARMIDRGVEVSFICPMMTARGEFVGLVTAEFLRRETAPQDAISALRRLERAALEVRIGLTEKERY